MEESHKKGKTGKDRGSEVGEREREREREEEYKTEEEEGKRRHRLRRLTHNAIYCLGKVI